VPTLSHTINETPVPRSTLVELFFEAVEQHRGRVAFQRMTSETSLEDITYDAVLAMAKQIAAGLAARGVQRGDRVAILSENRPEWAVVDYGCLCAGVPCVPIYTTLTPPQIAYLLADSGARLLFASSDEQVQ
jgi:long-chain acyl-CoA synthetase